MAKAHTNWFLSLQTESCLESISELIVREVHLLKSICN